MGKLQFKEIITTLFISDTRFATWFLYSDESYDATKVFIASFVAATFKSSSSSCGKF